MRPKVVFVVRLSLFTGGLYSDVVYTAFLDWRNLKWSLYTDGLYSMSLTHVRLYFKVTYHTYFVNNFMKTLNTLKQ